MSKNHTEYLVRRRFLDDGPIKIPRGLRKRSIAELDMEIKKLERQLKYRSKVIKNKPGDKDV